MSYGSSAAYLHKSLFLLHDVFVVQRSAGAKDDTDVSGLRLLVFLASHLNSEAETLQAFGRSIKAANLRSFCTFNKKIICRKIVRSPSMAH